MIKSRNQNGSALVVVIIFAVVAILGVLGYVAWSNFFAPKDDKVTQTTTSVQVDEDTVAVDPNEGYLVIEDWDVRFKLPENSGEIRFYKDSGSDTEGYSFSTKRVEDLGERCVEPNDIGEVIRLAGLNRSTELPDEDPIYPRDVPVNEGKPINGYYYYAFGAQSLCAVNGSGATQAEDRNMIYEMLLEPSEAE